MICMGEHCGSDLAVGCMGALAAGCMGRWVSGLYGRVAVICMAPPAAATGSDLYGGPAGSDLYGGAGPWWREGATTSLALAVDCMGALTVICMESGSDLYESVDSDLYYSGVVVQLYYE